MCHRAHVSKTHIIKHKKEIITHQITTQEKENITFIYLIYLFLPSTHNKIILLLTTGVGSAAMVALLMCILICCFRSKSLIQQVKYLFWTKNDKNIEAFSKDHGALSQKRYKYSEIKNMTNSFKDKLRQGGF